MKCLPILLILLSENGIMRAARITAAHPVVFADSFAMALAQAENASVITGDADFPRCAVLAADWIGL